MSETSASSRVPTSIVAIGVGNRMRTYMHYVADHPELARLVAVVEPDPVRRDAMGDQFGVPQECRYEDYHDYFNNPVKADVAFICTPEREHFEPCMAALRMGCHVLLEKPVAQSYEQCRLIQRAAEHAGRIVCVCHVLRYHPAFLKVKELVASGRYGRIVSITHTEDVGIDRTTHSYVRGVMNTEAGNNPMLIAKCCHDIDFLLWVSGQKCKKLSSFGSRLWFRRENAPVESATRCINCGIEKTCPYSAVDLYWRRREWISNFTIPAGKTVDDAVRYELEEGPYGRCVYHCDNDVVDNQVLNMQMEDNSIITLCMDCFTRRDGRTTDIKMTNGEIISDGIKISAIDFSTDRRDTYDFSDCCRQPFHAGADLRLVEAFLAAVHGEGSTEMTTTIADSMISHRLCFEAERSRHTGTTIIL